MRTIAIIALGSNLGDRETALDRALERLNQFEDMLVVRRSPVYETEPLGMPEGTPAFLNAVAEIETNLSPRELLEILLQVEREAGRVRQGCAPTSRTLDLDLLLYGDRIIDEPDLQIPHPRMAKRRFVLAPLADLAPELRLPGERRTVRELLGELDDSVQRVQAPRQPTWNHS